MVRAIANIEGSMHKTNSYVDKVRHHQTRINRSSSAGKKLNGGRDQVGMDVISRLKTRVNYALVMVIKGLADARERDKVMTEGLLDTMMGTK
jgi:hypothetical protein